MTRPPPSSTLFPYTTLFRSDQPLERVAAEAQPRDQTQRRQPLEPQGAGRRVQPRVPLAEPRVQADTPDRKSTRLNSSHPSISYAVFCLKKKKKKNKKT